MEKKNSLVRVKKKKNSQRILSFDFKILKWTFCPFSETISLVEE